MTVSAAEVEAAHLLAVRLAATSETHADWNRALDQLEKSAALGHRLGQASLAALAGDWPLAGKIAAGANPDPQSWDSMRRKIRIADWLASPAPRKISDSPRIAIIDGFAPPQICDWLIARARPKLRPATTYDSATGETRKDPTRTNTDFQITVEETDVIIAILRARIAAITALPLRALEGTTILHYSVGEQFLPHYDFIEETMPGYAKEMAEWGQRAVTFLMPLNDEYSGGETDFPIVGQRYRRPKGAALLFWNIGPDGAPDRRTLHAGLPPTQGEKWLLSQWQRARATQPVPR